MLAIEASRLARNGRDWHTLLEFCGLVGTLIVDEDGIEAGEHAVALLGRDIDEMRTRRVVLDVPRQLARPPPEAPKKARPPLRLVKSDKGEDKS